MHTGTQSVNTKQYIRTHTQADANLLLKSTGLDGWDTDAFDQLWSAVSVAIPFAAHLKEAHAVIHRLGVYLASPAGEAPVSDDELAAFIPSPNALIETDRIPLFQ